MKNLTNITSIIAFVLFLTWLVVEPSYEPAIGVIITIGTYIKHRYSKRNKINKIVYVINIRGYDKQHIKQFITEMTTEFFEIKNFRTRMVDGDWYDVIIETKERISHKDLYDYAREISKKDGCKVYEVRGENKTYGLRDGEGPLGYD